MCIKLTQLGFKLCLCHLLTTWTDINHLISLKFIYKVRISWYLSQRVESMKLSETYEKSSWLLFASHSFLNKKDSETWTRLTVLSTYGKCRAGFFSPLGGIHSAIIAAPKSFRGCKASGHDSAQHEEQTWGIWRTLWPLMGFDSCFYASLKNRAKRAWLKKKVQLFKLDFSLRKKKEGNGVPISSRTVLSERGFCNDGNILYLRWPIQ